MTPPRSLYLIVTDYLCVRCGHSWRECYSILRTSEGALGGTPNFFEAKDMPVSATRFRIAPAPVCWHCAPGGEIYHDPPLPSAAAEPKEYP